MNRTLKEGAILKNIEGTPWIAFPVFERFPELVCGFSTRLGGVSRGIFASMNLGFRRGDAQENVTENYRLICRSMRIEPERLVFTDQVHGTVVRRAGEADCGKGIVRERDYSGVDGHITDEPGVPLLVFSADCVPLFLYDRGRRAIGAVHAGWKGTVGGIAAEAVRRMTGEFGSRPEDIFAVIGPSAGPDCYEVGEDVAGRFYEEFGGVERKVDAAETGGTKNDGGNAKTGCSRETGSNAKNDGGNGAGCDAKTGCSRINVKNGLPAGMSAAGLSDERPEIVRPAGGGQPGKYLVSLWEANRRMLTRAGLPEENIFVSGLCTICRQELFFSHRATGGKRGSMAGFMMLRE